MVQDFDEIISAAKKLLPAFQAEDRRKRKQTLIDLQELVSNSDFSEQDLLAFFVETHLHTLNCFRDKTESVREQAIKYTSFLIVDKLPINDFYLTYVFPVIVERIGSPEIIEESEELRLELIKFLQMIVLKYANTEQLKPFLGDIIVVLQQSLKDKHPAIKETCCDCVLNVAEALPRDFHMQAESLVKALIANFGHQRYKVRVKAIKAIGEVVMHSSYNALNDAVGPLAERLFDQIAVVRQTVGQVAGRWLLEYRDRYSFFHKILPLLLTGLNDELEETRIESQQLWDKVGLQYQQENEKDFKDQLDFCLEPPKYYPQHLKRPNLGCRVLVQRNVSKLSKALSYELTSWQADVRFRCSQLLCSLTLHAEENITQNLQDILPAMYSAARDEDKRIVLNVIQAGEYIGLFTQTETWCKILLPVIEDSVNAGHLIVLGALIKGAPREKCCNFLQQITDVLSDDNICVTRKKNIQIELANCIHHLMEKYDKSSSSDVGYGIFKIIVTLIALRDRECLNVNASLVDELKSALALPDCYTVWSNYVSRLLDHIAADPKAWTSVTPQRCIFETILLESNEAFGENLDIIETILKEALDCEADAEARLKTFWALSSAFERKDVIFRKAQNPSSFIFNIISDVFVPSLIWHPGRTAEALRTMTLSCLLSSLTPSPDLDLLPIAELWPLLLSSLEDSSYHTRQLSIQCLILLCEKNTWNCEDFLKIYPEYLKRLDDPIDKVRLCAVEHLSKLFTSVPEQFKQSNFKAHHELIIDTLLTHFDDSDNNLQDLIFEAIKVFASVNLEEVANKVARHKPLLRNQKGCEEILKYLEKLNL